MRSALALEIRSLSARACIACLLAAGAAGAAEPTAQEQLFVYEVNRARSDPPAWAAELGLSSLIGGDGMPTTLASVAPRPPLALNEMLVSSSRFHAAEMAANDYFDHQSAVTGDWPNKMVRDAGYPLPLEVMVGAFIIPLPDDSNQVESIACGFGPGMQNLAQALNAIILLVVDAGVPSLGHRKHLLGFDDFGFNESFREVGAGFGSDSSASCRNYWAFHTGREAVLATFLTGVVFADANANELYDAGEGLAGVTVTVGGTPVTSNAAGGWSLEVADGTHLVECSGGGFAGSAAVEVAVAGQNREVDCVSGFDGAYVDFVPVPEAPAGALGLAALGALGLAARARAARGRARGAPCYSRRAGTPR